MVAPQRSLRQTEIHDAHRSEIDHRVKDLAISGIRLIRRGDRRHSFVSVRYGLAMSALMGCNAFQVRECWAAYPVILPGGPAADGKWIQRIGSFMNRQVPSYNCREHPECGKQEKSFNNNNELNKSIGEQVLPCFTVTDNS